MIAEDSLRTRKYKSYDTIAIRKTLLVPDLGSSDPKIEKVITEDSVTYFDYERRRACSIRTPTLAIAERSSFEVLWSTLIHYDDVTETLQESVGEGENEPRQLYLQLYAKFPHWMREFLKSVHLIQHGQWSNHEALRKTITICTKNRPGIVHDITRCFVARNINIAGLRIFAVPPGGPFTYFDLKFETNSVQDSDCVLREIKKVPSVLSVKNR